MNNTSRVGLPWWVLLSLLAVALAATAVVVRLTTAPRGASLQFVLRDAVSRSWVWDATATLQDRVIHSYYQSDDGTTPRRFTRLERGDHALLVTAPSYSPQRVPVRITGRNTVLEEPVAMVGYEIPELAGFLVFETVGEGAYISELRPVRKDGRAAVDHPCLDLWVGCIVSVQTLDGVPTPRPVESGSDRGQTLFRSEIDWEWDSSPNSLFRYRARVPFSEFSLHQAPYLVFDYLIVVPDPRLISSTELDGVMKEVWATPDVTKGVELLQEYREKLDFFVDTSWNVERAW